MADRVGVNARLYVTSDAVALAAFVLVGARSHHATGALSVLARNAVPLLGSWFAAATLLGAYRRPGRRTLLATWAIAIPVGLLLRTAWVGSPTGLRLLQFVGVGLAFTLVFLVAGRAIAVAIAHRVSRPGAERGSMGP